MAAASNTVSLNSTTKLTFLEIVNADSEAEGAKMSRRLTSIIGVDYTPTNGREGYVILTFTDGIKMYFTCGVQTSDYYIVSTVNAQAPSSISDLYAKILALL